MSKVMIRGLGVLLIAAHVCAAQQAERAEQHRWLERFVGPWESSAQVVVAPDQPPIQLKGTQTARMLGGIWMIAEGNSTVGDMKMQSVLTLGYDAEKGHFVGTWIDSVHNYLWTYRGKLDETGEILTLDTEGPNPMEPGKLFKYREVIQFKSKDHYVFSSAIQTEADQWFTFITVDFRRKVEP